ncbi:hypothetical protein C2G38_2027348 [Gigaspora rosea]|uniref:Uncharacterized protein n=1 Tax=Gigaspora rosea TaxID=44941 RepID=A0A397W583_9GLOM|nr:hypothetical protein C2G38_2027348 [Gigaspora rosea]
MLNKEILERTRGNLSTEKPEKFVGSSNEVSQIDDNFNQSYVVDLCKLYNEERSKGNNVESILDIIDQLLIKQNSDDVINWLSNDRINPVALSILAGCYLYGKWVKKDKHQAFVHYQKSAVMEFVDGIYHVGYCYQNKIGVKKDNLRHSFIIKNLLKWDVLMECIKLVFVIVMESEL